MVARCALEQCSRQRRPMERSRRLLGIGLLAGAVLTGCAQEGADEVVSPQQQRSALTAAGTPSQALSGRVIVKFRDDSKQPQVLSQRTTRNAQSIQALGG